MGGRSRQGIARFSVANFLSISSEEHCDRADTQGTQVTETPDKDKQIDKPPEVPQPQAPSSRLTVTLVSMAALVVVAAATANFLPNIDGLALPSFNRPTLPKFDTSMLPNFLRGSAPKSNRVAAPAPPKPAPPVLVPDPIARAALIDIQMSQQQNATVLASLTQNSTSLQTDLKRVSRQLSTLSAQVEVLQKASAPLTTSSITPSHPRARIIRAARKTSPEPLPKPVGPVSVGGAPLSPTPGAGSGV